MPDQPTSLPLQTKVSLTLLVLIGLFIAASYVILGLVIAPAFDDLEMSAARSDLKRGEMALQTDLDNLEALTADWAPWDDIYSYVLGASPGFERSNLARVTLENLSLDLLVIFGNSDRLMWGQVLIDGKERNLNELGILSPDNPAGSLLTSHRSADNPTAGIIATNLGPMLISSRPILKTDNSGPVAGALIMGQFLNDARLARLRERTEVDLFWSFGATDDSLPLAAGDIEFSTRESLISGQMWLEDIHGAPYLLLQSSTPRSISSLGNHTVDVALLFLGIAGLIVTGIVWIMLRMTILKPIDRLGKHMRNVRQSGDLSQRMDKLSYDEIGRLARQFDDLTGAVHEARQALLDQSFKAGKADTAAEVLHNIRNAMTPMINGLERLRRAFKVTESLRVEDATSQLADPECPPDRKDKLLEYINASFKHVARVGDDATEDLKIATSQARQIEGILTDQEKFANVAPVSEILKVEEVLGEAVHVIPKEAQPEIGLKIPGDLSAMTVKAHRIGLLQVLGNLILNAYESIQRCKGAEGRIHFEAELEMLADEPMVRLTVRDNGSGFNESTSKMIFQRGFTSKTKGESTGLGIHWCANAIAGMGGRIRAESPGLGQGAEFHVLLPAAQGG